MKEVTTDKEGLLYHISDLESLGCIPMKTIKINNNINIHYITIHKFATKKKRKFNATLEIENLKMRQEDLLIWNSMNYDIINTCTT